MVTFNPKLFKYLNIGGRNFSQRNHRWLNLDYPFPSTKRKQKEECIDVVHNLMSETSLPFPDNSFAGVYSEHCLEHLPFAVSKFTISEMFRITKKGGVVRISIPDSDLFYQLMVGASSNTKGFPTQWIPGESRSATEIFIDVAMSPIITTIDLTEYYLYCKENVKQKAFDRLDEAFDALKYTKEDQAKKPGHHISWWNEKRLTEVFNKSKARSTAICKQNESREAAFKSSYIDQTAPSCSIRIEAVK